MLSNSSEGIFHAPIFKTPLLIPQRLDTKIMNEQLVNPSPENCKNISPVISKQCSIEIDTSDQSVKPKILSRGVAVFPPDIVISSSQCTPSFFPIEATNKNGLVWTKNNPFIDKNYLDDSLTSDESFKSALSSPMKSVKKKTSSSNTDVNEETNGHRTGTSSTNSHLPNSLTHKNLFGESDQNEISSFIGNDEPIQATINGDLQMEGIIDTIGEGIMVSENLGSPDEGKLQFPTEINQIKAKNVKKNYIKRTLSNETNKYNKAVFELGNSNTQCISGTDDRKHYEKRIAKSVYDLSYQEIAVKKTPRKGDLMKFGKCSRSNESILNMFDPIFQKNPEDEENERYFLNDLSTTQSNPIYGNLFECSTPMKADHPGRKNEQDDVNMLANGGINLQKNIQGDAKEVTKQSEPHVINIGINYEVHTKNNSIVANKQESHEQETSENNESCVYAHVLKKNNVPIISSDILISNETARNKTTEALSEDEQMVQENSERSRKVIYPKLPKEDELDIDLTNKPLPPIPPHQTRYEDSVKHMNALDKSEAVSVNSNKDSDELNKNSNSVKVKEIFDNKTSKDDKKDIEKNKIPHGNFSFYGYEVSY